MAQKEAKSSIQVIERMMALLDALARHPQPVNLKPLATETALHPSTAHRILGVLVECGLVERIEPGTYRLGMRLMELGNLVKSRFSVRQQALPHMRSLHEALGEMVNLSVRADDEVVYVERTAPAAAAMRVVQALGARAPLHVTAVGKIFLAHEGPDGCAHYASRTGLPRYTENTLTDSLALAAEIERVRLQGYALDNEESEQGVCCIGAGIYDDEGRLVAGLSVSAPAERLRRDWAIQVRGAAAEISRAIGFNGSNASGQ